METFWNIIFFTKEVYILEFFLNQQLKTNFNFILWLLIIPNKWVTDNQFTINLFYIKEKACH